LREFEGAHTEAAEPQARLHYDASRKSIELEVTSAEALLLTIVANAYRADGPQKLALSPGKSVTRRWSLSQSGHWYDFTARSEGWSRRFAGRLETGAHSVSDLSVAGTELADTVQT